MTSCHAGLAKFSEVAPSAKSAFTRKASRRKNPIYSLTYVRYDLRMKETKLAPLDGDRLLAAMAALANPHRLRIIGLLASNGRNYISQIAREIGISRPLLHLHLQKLESAGLVTSQLELSGDGKALNYFEVTDFVIKLSPTSIAESVRSLKNSLETER